MPDRVDAFLGSLAAGQLVEPLDGAFLLEIDRDRAGRLGHRQALGQPVDRDDLFRAQQDRAADRHLPDRAAAPDRDRVGRLDVALHRGLPAGRKDVAEEQQLLVGDAVRHLDVRRVGERHAQIFGLPALIAAGQVRVAEQPGRGVAERGVGQRLVAVGALADREIAAPALLAFAADDRERDDDALANLELVFRAGADLDDFAHRLVAHDVADLHAGHEMVEEMQVGAADRAARDLDDRVAVVLDPGVGDSIAADIRGAVPHQGFHNGSLHKT